VFGGEPGTTGYCKIRRGGQTIRLRSKDEAMLQQGDIVTLAVGGGGGYGDLAQRAPDRIAADAADGYVIT
jgi:N-methylhydantoinase B